MYASDETGLGLGFFIAKTLLERSGAKLTFVNRPFPSSGAVVTVRWTRAEFEQLPQSPNLSRAPQTLSYGMDQDTRPRMNMAPAIPTERSLLIVDDDKSFLQRLARAMEGRGFAVTTAESVVRRPDAGREDRRRPSPWSTCGLATATAST